MVYQFHATEAFRFTFFFFSFTVYDIVTTRVVDRENTRKSYFDIFTARWKSKGETGIRK